MSDTIKELEDTLCESCGKSTIHGSMVLIKGIGWMHTHCEIKRLHEALKTIRMELGLIDSQSRRGLIFHHISNARRIIRETLKDRS